MIKLFSAHRSLVALTILAGTGALAACSTLPTGGVSAPAASAAFSKADFAWSASSGQGGIEGRIGSAQGGNAFACVGSVGLTPATRFTDARMQTLYGSTSRAQLPADVVRARTVSDPNEDYREFVRSTTCANNSFKFEGLPDGRWYVIAPVKAGDGPVIVMMQQVQIRNGRTVNLTL
ncbi:MULTISPECIES: hypothetical protein [unclassified Brevundimonas]|uniref:hypothetical protein n=1 Tax=unclassified Brevundimonas TaxID=2622653 RepID=UPI0025C28AD3|nr:MULTISPECIES: hypothetical protein [unclassified Brevundimonas]